MIDFVVFVSRHPRRAVPYILYNLRAFCLSPLDCPSFQHKPSPLNPLSVSPLGSAFTSHSQLVENTGRVSPLECAFTYCDGLTPLESAFTQTPAGGAASPTSILKNHLRFLGQILQAKRFSVPVFAPRARAKRMAPAFRKFCTRGKK